MTTHATWCTNHQSAGDPDDGYCDAAEVTTAGFEFYISNGTLDGRTVIFFDKAGVGNDQSVTATEARALGQQLLALSALLEPASEGPRWTSRAASSTSSTVGTGQR